MRSVALLLVGVAAVTALPMLEDAPSISTVEILHKLLQANPQDNDVVPRDKDIQLPSSTPLSVPSPSSSLPAIQLSTAGGKEEKKIEDKLEQSKEIEEQQQNQESTFENSEENVMKPLPVEPVEAEEVPTIHVLEPIPVQPEEEELPRIDTFMDSAVDEEPQPIQEESMVEEPQPIQEESMVEEPQPIQEESVVDYLPMDLREVPLAFEPIGEEEEDKYETEYFPFSVEPVIVELPPESEGDGFPVENSYEFEGDEFPLENPYEFEGDGFPVEDPSEFEGDGYLVEDPSEFEGDGFPVEDPSEFEGDGFPVEDPSEFEGDGFLEDPSEFEGDGFPVEDPSEFEGDGYLVEDPSEFEGDGFPVEDPSEFEGDGFLVEDPSEFEDDGFSEDPSEFEGIPMEGPYEFEGDGFPVEDSYEFEGDELPIDEYMPEEGSYESPTNEEEDMLFTPDLRSSYLELEGEDLPFEPEMEPLPEDDGYGDETYSEDNEENEGIISYTFQETDIPEDTVIEEIYEPLGSQMEEGLVSNENAPTGFFSWVLPGDFVDEETSEPIPSDLYDPTHYDASEYEGVEDEFSPDVPEDEILESETSDEVNDPSEHVPFIIDHEVDSDEEYVEEIPDYEEIPYEEISNRDVYFPPHDDTFFQDWPWEDYYLLGEDMLPDVDDDEEIFSQYDYDETLREEEEGIPLNGDSALVETFPVVDYQSSDDSMTFVDEMPREPNSKEVPSIFFLSPDHKEKEEEESFNEDPLLNNLLPVADDDMTVIGEPPSLQIFSELKPIVSIVSDSKPIPKPFASIPFPLWNMKKRREPTNVSLFDLLNILAVGAAQKDSMDTQVPAKPIVGEPFTPQGRPLPIAEYPKQDFHHMDQAPNWIPDNNNNNHKAQFSSFISGPTNGPMLSDQLSNNLAQSSFPEPHAWTHQQPLSQDNAVNTMNNHFQVQDNMHYHHPPTFMDSSTTFKTDASQLNGVKFSDSYQPPIKFKKTAPYPSNVNNWFNSFKPSNFEVFGLPHHHRQFSSSQDHYGPGRFPHHSQSSPSDFMVFHSQYQPEEDMYLNGPQHHMEHQPLFYHSSGRHSPRPSPFTILNRAWSPPNNDRFPMEITFYPDREPHYDYPISSSRRPHNSFNPFQSFPRDSFSHGPYYGGPHYPQQGYLDPFHRGYP
ncbi:hypothetical protein Pmani_029525 [Petrolisthes manimaculis]|uniref:Enamelin n=1 Tax=Petrolisthes manimaculis TaxID=1843537 RepID=A0AAE1TUD4_9EUCA|nr:hypothetical protein Pmani_029525 [Petrolisthes manimaculis]